MMSVRIVEVNRTADIAWFRPPLLTGTIKTPLALVGQKPGALRQWAHRTRQAGVRLGQGSALPRLHNYKAL